MKNYSVLSLFALSACVGGGTVSEVGDPDPLTSAEVTSFVNDLTEVAIALTEDSEDVEFSEVIELTSENTPTGSVAYTGGALIGGDPFFSAETLVDDIQDEYVGVIGRMEADVNFADSGVTVSIDDLGLYALSVSEDDLSNGSLGEENLQLLSSVDGSFEGDGTITLSIETLAEGLSAAEDDFFNEPAAGSEEFSPSFELTGDMSGVLQTGEEFNVSGTMTGAATVIDAGDAGTVFGFAATSVTTGADLTVTVDGAEVADPITGAVGVGLE